MRDTWNGKAQTLALHLGLRNSKSHQIQRIVAELLLLLRVHGGKAGCGRRRRAPSRVRQVRRDLPALQRHCRTRSAPLHARLPTAPGFTSSKAAL